MKMSASDGTIPRRSLIASGQPRMVRASAGSAGMIAGFRMLSASTKRQKMATWTTLAPMAPLYMSPTDRPS